MPEGVRTQTKGAADAGPPPGPEEFRAVLSRLASGVVAVTGLDSEGRPAGLTVSSFVSVSLDPPLVSFCVARTSRTWPLLRAGGRVCVNILSEGQAAARLGRGRGVGRPRPARRPHRGGAPGGWGPGGVGGGWGGVSVAPRPRHYAVDLETNEVRYKLADLGHSAADRALAAAGLTAA